MEQRLISQLAQQEGVTERLKAEHQMEWVARMNNIRHRADEIVLNELIYAQNTDLYEKNDRQIGICSRLSVVSILYLIQRSNEN